MTRILVSGASGIVGYGILRSLRLAEKKLHLIGSSIYEDSVAPAFCDTFELAPKTDDPSYLPWLCDCIRSGGIDLIIPGIEIDMHQWARHTTEIESHGARAMLNNPSLIALCKDKWRFFQDLQSAVLGCEIESVLEGTYEELESRFGRPFLLKPRRGFGSKGIVRVDGKHVFAKHAAEVGATLMAQPIIGDDENEFTVSAFCDGRGGYCAAMSLRRKLSKDGFTEKAEVVENGQFSAVIEALCKRYLPVGPTNFQFRTAGEDLKLLEINPRISSSTAIRAAFGYNESLMSVDYYLDGRAPIQPTIRRGKAIRYIDEFIAYEDRLYI